MCFVIPQLAQTVQFQLKQLFFLQFGHQNPNCVSSPICKDTDMNREELGNAMTVRAKPAGVAVLKNNGHRDDEGESKLEPHVGLEFDSAEDAQEFYNLYATQLGFRIRIGQLYRSRVDGAVISRRFVCSKEGFQTNSRTGCPAFIRVQKTDSGKWLLANIKKEHNHEFERTGEIRPPHIQRKALPASRSSVVVSSRTGLRSVEEEDGRPSPSGVIDVKRLKREEVEGEIKVEPYKGLEFDSANEAYKFYFAYAANAGFKIRIGQLFRSKNDGSITSRRFVCSKEGHQHPSRLGCGAFMRIQRRESGKWVVDRLQKEHNHDLESPMDPGKKIAAFKGFKEEVFSGLEDVDLLEENDGLSLVKRGRVSNIGSDWYHVLLEYFQSRLADDTGFFYAVEVDGGKCMSVFWADGRSRFACSQFGDAVVFDTTYRSSTYLVPFASFIGVNHHRQPVLLGCALIADQDKAIQHSIAQVFPRTHHRFSAWQIKAKEQQNMGAILSMDTEFKYEYEACIYQSQTPSEFDSAWNGITMDGSMNSFFGTFLNAQTPLNEFVLRYEKALEQHREEERKEDFNSFNLQAVLHTKDPIEEQCRRLYTMAMFKVFQKELLECYRYVGMKINVEGALSRYLVQKCGNGDERNTVAFNASNLNVDEKCQKKSLLAKLRNVLSEGNQRWVTFYQKRGKIAFIKLDCLRLLNAEYLGY
ncbi:hypothetical protein F0562_034749 [Nyssa sinensis]|uniref:Protein FAR1-RELATED SEQUENCE n=1 Tax=Nyssa sinensis TaxID=561372 RepID=A0A5J5ACR3_9ASTE|nr:hypothetical protein F0562_034749 [Nyssa sinensis]